MCVEIQIENGPRLDCLGELWGLFVEAPATVEGKDARK